MKPTWYRPAASPVTRYEPSARVVTGDVRSVTTQIPATGLPSEPVTTPRICAAGWITAVTVTVRPSVTRTVSCAGSLPGFGCEQAGSRSSLNTPVPRPRRRNAPCRPRPAGTEDAGHPARAGRVDADAAQRLARGGLEPHDAADRRARAEHRVLAGEVRARADPDQRGPGAGRRLPPPLRRVVGSRSAGGTTARRSSRRRTADGDGQGRCPRSCTARGRRSRRPARAACGSTSAHMLASGGLPGS